MTNKTENNDPTIENEENIHSSASQSSSKSRNNRKWSINKLFWGLLLILVGGLMLASNFGFVNVNWGNVWRLWPLIIVSAGLSIMSFRSIIWRILMVLLVILSLGIITWVVVGDSSSLSIIHSQESSVSKLSTDVKQAEVSIKVGASVLKIGTADQKQIANVNLESNYSTLSKTSVQSNDTQQIDFFMTNNNSWWTGDIRNIWDVKLTQSMPIVLNIDAGASQTKIDTSAAMLKEMNIKAGASSLDLKLGSVENTSNINIDSGASSVTLRTPVNVGVRLKLEGGLTTKKLSDLTETTTDTFESLNYAQSKKQINIIAKIGVSSLDVIRY